MVAVILIFGFFGIALGTGWAAQLLVGKGRRINWTQAFWVGLAGMGLAALIGYLLDKHAGATFGIAGTSCGGRFGRRDPVVPDQPRGDGPRGRAPSRTGSSPPKVSPATTQKHHAKKKRR